MQVGKENQFLAIKKPIPVHVVKVDEECDIQTLEGVMHANIGDYIITGIDGEKYPCKKEIFKKTYKIIKK